MYRTLEINYKSIYYLCVFLSSNISISGKTMCKIQKLKLNNFVESFYRSVDESTGRKVFGVPTNGFEEKRVFINGTVLNLFTVNLATVMNLILFGKSTA